MKPPPFEYRRPESVEEALSVLAEAGDDAKVLAGGQSLIPLLAFRMVRPEMLVDISRLSELDHVTLEDGLLSVGATTTHRRIELTDALATRCPAILEAVRNIGHIAIRNRGTVGGSMAHADPAAEWPVLALVLDTEFQVQSAKESRLVPAANMFVSYMQTGLRPDEILTGMRFKLPTEKAGSAFVEVARRHGDFAMGGAAAVLALEQGKVVHARVGVMSAALTPVRSEESERLLMGEEPTDELLAEAAERVSGAVDPLDDVHAPADYKRHLAKVTTRRALISARDRAKEAGG
jgi:CO/xanthine dehydrogenase FAD-binding subunit